MNKYRSRGTLVFLYLLSQQGIALLFIAIVMGYACYFFYDIGEVPFGRGGSSIYVTKSSDPFLFLLVWLFFFACFLSSCALYIYSFHKGTRRVTELRRKPYC
jgi:hypothetical protein